jgi:hypothetical protein
MSRARVPVTPQDAFFSRVRRVGQGLPVAGVGVVGQPGGANECTLKFKKANITQGCTILP